MWCKKCKIGVGRFSFRKKKESGELKTDWNREKASIESQKSRLCC